MGSLGIMGCGSRGLRVHGWGEAKDGKIIPLGYPKYVCPKP